jgi:predicted regulator of Ras-like GTPase activity (Roadblock/LC7/MglB family)
MFGTPFAEILRVAVESTPSAIGGAFAARDGEMVDFFLEGNSHEWAILTAHYGVVLANVQAALNTCHYGEANLVMITHTGINILIHSVNEGYYALMAVSEPAPLALAMTAIEQAAQELRREMG